MAHTCNAGCGKLVVMPDGKIIPCEAFKGLVDDLPEFVLGHISNTTLEQAKERGERLPYLMQFREQKEAADLYHAHLDECEQCEQHPFNQCPEGMRLLQDFGDKYTAFQGTLDDMKERRTDVQRRDAPGRSTG